MANTKKYLSLDKLGLYDEKIKKVITDVDAASLQAAKDYADGLATNYDAAGSAATEAGKVQDNLDAEILRAKAAEEANAAAVKQAQDEVDALELVVAEKAAQTDLDALAGKVGEVPEDKTVMGIITEIQANAYDDTEVRGLISDLEDTKADKTQVATDIETAVNAEKTARETAVAGVQSAVDTLSDTHATDKKALEDAIALKADKSALDQVSDVANAAVKQSDYDTKMAALDAEDARIAGLVDAEAQRAAAAEGNLEDRIETMEAFWEAAQADGTDSNVIDTLKEIQEYISSDETGASEMAASIKQNSDAIADHIATDHDFAAADATLKSELEGKIDLKADATVVEGIDGRLTTAEGKITTAEGKIATIEGQVSALEEASATHALKTDVEELQGDFDEYTAAHEGDYTNAQIDAAIKVNTDAIAALNDTYASDEELAQAIADEVARANGAYAAKTLETTVTDHVADTVAHVNAEDKVKWNSALQAADITTGATNGTIAVKGTDVAVKGLGSAAYTEASAYDVAGAADGALTSAKGYADNLNGAMDTRVLALETWHNNFTEISEQEINDLFA